MKRTAFLLLLIFTMVQIVPAVKVVCNNSEVVSVFNPDEEKNGETANSSIEEIKEKKNYSHYFDVEIVTHATDIKFILANHTDELPSPFLDMQTPPPNQA
ncbi:MAG: hypothetical protein H7Y86_16880 [Rhizobacter sp.]|nr:hypothetical protein [Ferruginibacter sp.]